jgi:hypothetical protein
MRAKKVKESPIYFQKAAASILVSENIREITDKDLLNTYSSVSSAVAVDGFITEMTVLSLNVTTHSLKNIWLYYGSCG